MIRDSFHNLMCRELDVKWDILVFGILGHYFHIWRGENREYRPQK